MPDLESLPDGSPFGRDRSSAAGPARDRGTVASGFGSAAEDATVRRIDLNDALIRHPEATFVMRAAGTAMRDAGIDDGDVLLVDRAITASPGHVVIAVVEGELTCRCLASQGGRLVLRAASPGAADIVPGDGVDIEVWGVVTTVIKSLRV
jgi:DNA polymerase V